MSQLIVRQKGRGTDAVAACLNLSGEWGAAVDLAGDFAARLWESPLFVERLRGF
ncbi:MAG: hypothetical protein P8J91_03660 [Pirellulaceae bacterium]|nr:hypothetical protein [Pirellulaceae bacterium]MDG2102823.1 hypothetical protein [Pirellulaceae bacterium]